MKGIKRGLLIAVAVILVLATAACIILAQKKSGKIYYTQLINPGKATGVVLDEYSVEYRYLETGFDENGTKIDLDFYSNRERALRTGAYLAVTVNDKYGVVTYREVQKKDIPAKAAEALENYAA